MNAIPRIPDDVVKAKPTISRRLWQWMLRLTAALIILLLLGAALAWWMLHASLAQLDGHRTLTGLEAAVVIERDARGVPLIRATNRIDAARALGFVHAQERFFQMDLMRRSGAGELAELFGPALVERDLKVRRHAFRVAARRELERIAAADRAVLEAYVAGVNAGLDALGTWPPEYLLLRVSPTRWRADDTLLVAYAMFLDLQDSSGWEDRRRAAVARALPTAAAAFFFPSASTWDAAVDNSSLTAPTIPGPEVIDFSREPFTTTARGIDQPESDWEAGSNSWGVEGSASATGSAIVANDPHLGLNLPNIWFHACLEWTQPDGRTRRLVGATMPGVPTLIIGSNGEIAWGFTNATLDTTDLFIVEIDPADPGRYLAPDGPHPIERVTETIAVHGGTNRSLVFERTHWGPIVAEAGPGRKLALRWIPYLPGALGQSLLYLENASSVEEALRMAPHAGSAVQNLLVGDRAGRLAWTLCGAVPHRTGYDGRVPVGGRDGQARWDDWLDPANYPRFIAPTRGRLWTANNRIVGAPGYLALGIEETDPGARARQIRDDLHALVAPIKETDLLAIYRDDRALFLARWQALLLHTLMNPDPGTGTNTLRFRELVGHVRDWGSRAATNSVGYRVVRAFRLKVLDRLLEPAVARCRREAPGLGFRTDRQEFPAWAILEKRPPHLLNPKFPSYEALLLEAINAVLTDFDRQPLSLAHATWGRRNILRIQHPISRAVPWLGRWLDLDPVPLPGDTHMPRVQGVDFGASLRMIVSPGHEERGIFHMPGGASGHFLSPFYRAGHEAWLNVESSPLLPGLAQHRLVLQPSAVDR